MKIKQLLILSAVALSLAACGGHTHTFASEWTYDETNHWHAATCEHTDEKSGVAAHTLGADGKCTVCDYQQQPSYTKMTEEQFNALVNKIQTQGIAAEYDVLVKSGDTLVDKEKGSFKFDIASTSFEQLNYNDTGAVVSGSILKDLTKYEFMLGGWSVWDTLTEQQAKQTLGHELEGMAGLFFPSQTYADYNFDETTGKYTVDFTNEQQLDGVYVYTMDANGITKIEGTFLTVFEGVNAVFNVTTSSVNVGPQTITKPEVEQGSITLEGNIFVCTSIIEFEEIKDIEIMEGMTLGDMCEGYIGSTIAFKNNAFTWNIDKMSQIATGSFVQNEDSAYYIHEATNGFEMPEELRVQRPIEFSEDSIILEFGYSLPSGDSGNIHLVFDLHVAE